jgi:hypothetical protein
LPLQGRLLTEQGMAQLQTLTLSPELAQQRDAWLQLIALMNQRIAAVETALKN